MTGTSNPETSNNELLILKRQTQKKSNQEVPILKRQISKLRIKKFQFWNVKSRNNESRSADLEALNPISSNQELSTNLEASKPETTNQEVPILNRQIPKRQIHLKIKNFVFLLQV